MDAYFRAAWERFYIKATSSASEAYPEAGRPAGDGFFGISSSSPHSTTRIGGRALRNKKTQLKDCIEVSCNGTCIISSARHVLMCLHGENFVGEILRIRLAGRRYHEDGTEEGLAESYIVKRIPRPGSINHRFFNCRRMFDNEVYAYEVVLPRLEAFATSRRGRSVCFAKYHGRSGDFIALQDLTVLGYQMGNRVRGFDVEECSLVLEALSSFHALSLSMKVANGVEFAAVARGVQETVFCEESARGVLGACWKNGVRLAIRSLTERREPGLEPAIATLTSYLDSPMLGLMDVVKPDHPFDVICHGDLWTNNILLRYGEATDVRFIDLQNVRHASCALDIMHVLLTSLKSGLLAGYFYDLVSRYYDSLVERMRSLGCAPQFTVGDLREEIRRKARYGVCVACLLLTVVTKPASSAETEIEESQSAEDELERAYAATSNLYHERLLNLVTALMTLRVI